MAFYPTQDQQTKCKSCGENGLNGDLLVTYDVNRQNPNGEIMVLFFVLFFIFAMQKVQNVLIFLFSQVSNGYFVHNFAPTKVPRISKNVVFIIDRSGSMSGRKIKQVKNVIGYIPHEKIL